MEDEKEPIMTKVQPMISSSTALLVVPPGAAGGALSAKTPPLASPTPIGAISRPSALVDAVWNADKEVSWR